MSVFSIGDQVKYHVYAVLCHDKSLDTGFVKFGYTSNLSSRLRAVAQGSPIPAKYYAFIETKPLQSSAKFVEKALLKKFSNRKTRGEWFAFDFTSKKDKEDFNIGSSECFQYCKRKLVDHWWTKVSVASYDAIQKQKQVAWLRYNGFDNKARNLEKKNMREYAQYRG